MPTASAPAQEAASTQASVLVKEAAVTKAGASPAVHKSVSRPRGEVMNAADPAPAVVEEEKPVVIARTKATAVTRDEGLLRKAGRIFGGWFKKLNRMISLY